MITMNHLYYGDITVLGHILSFADGLYDMRIDGWRGRIEEKFGVSGYGGSEPQYDFSDECLTEDEIEDLSMLNSLNYFISEVLRDSEDWGFGETMLDDYKNPSAEIRALIAMNGRHLNKLTCDESALVRLAAAKHIALARMCLEDIDESTGRNLSRGLHESALHEPYIDILLNDTDPNVVSVIAKCCDAKHLDALLHHSSHLVRTAVAKRGLIEHLDVLVHDESHSVRHAVAKHTTCPKHHEILMQNEHEQSYVRAAVIKRASQDLLARLAEHKDWSVRAAVARRADTQVLEKLACDESAAVRRVVAYRGVGFDTLYRDPSWQVRHAVATHKDGAKYRSLMLSDDSSHVREVIAQSGFGVKTLLHDPSPDVRKAAASSGVNFEV